MIKGILHTTTKLLLVAILSSSIAYLLNMTEYILVGIISILSVSPTKKDSIVHGVKRYLDVIYALTLSTLFFVIFGFNLYVLVFFVGIFIFSSFLMKLEVGLVPSIVLSHHVYAFGSFDWMFLLEQVAIITLSIGIALLVNTFYPEFWLKQMKKQLQDVDQMLRDHLYMLSIILMQKEDLDAFLVHYELMNRRISSMVEEAELKDKNRVFSNDHRYLAYLYMRRNQLNYINNMYKSASRIKDYHDHQAIISAYIEALVADIGDDNKADTQVEKLRKLKADFGKDVLPKTRKEFETRAMLYHILEDLEAMLNAKSLFHQRYPDFVL